MAGLGKEELQDLDAEIDRSIGSQAILSLPRDIAMINLLRAFEDLPTLRSTQIRLSIYCTIIKARTGRNAVRGRLDSPLLSRSDC
jgi:hypothetical protein